MTAPNDSTKALYAFRERLRTISNEMIDLRSAYWASGNERASLAVDSARHGISRALHDLQRCDHALPQDIVNAAS